MKYAELKNKIQGEINDFPIEFAFNTKQFEKAIARLGAKKEECCTIWSGGIIRLTDRKAFFEMTSRHNTELDEAMKEDDFMVDAIHYELGNHEFCITNDPADTLETLGISLEDKRTLKLFGLAEKQYLDEQK